MTVDLFARAIRIKTLRFITIILLGLVSVLPLGAAPAEPPPVPLTVEEAVAQALRSNPVPRAASREVAAAGAGVRSAQALTNPTLTVNPGVLGPAGSDEELSVVQPLEISGVRGARTGVARAELRAARSAAIVTTRDLVRDVKVTYYELARAQEVLELQRQSVGFAEEFERIARRQVELGARPGIDVTQLQVELTRTRQLQLQAETGVQLAVADLNTLMGRAPDTPVAAVSHLAYAPQSAEGALSTETALSQRAEVAAAQARLEVLQSQGRLIRAEGRPDLALSGRMESLTDHPRTGGIGLEITLPFLDYGSRRERLRQTERLADAQAARVESTRLEVQRDLATALIRLRAAEQLARRYQEGLLDQARRLAEAERTRFQTGAGSPLAVLEAQRTYRWVLSDYYGALAERWAASHRRRNWCRRTAAPRRGRIHDEHCREGRDDG